MELTPQELEHISPGIYRFSHRLVGRPNLDDPDNDGLIKTLTEVKGQKGPDNGRLPNYVASPEEFLDLWMKGYGDFPDTAGQYPDQGHLAPRSKGFELFYVNWHPEDPHHRIGGREMTRAGGERLEYMMIASDINGMNDQSGYMNVGVNDFDHERVLVWRGKKPDEVFEFGGPIPYNELPHIESKPMRDDISFYVFNHPDRFPFDSPNLLKSAGGGGANGVWTMIGFKPEAVYSKLQDMGFVFPPVK